MAWRGSLSRSVMTAARTSIRTPPPAPRLRPPSMAAPRLQSPRMSFTNPRYSPPPPFFTFSSDPQEFGRTGLRTVVVTAACRNSPHIPPDRQRAGLLRALSREERKRWVMRGDVGDQKRSNGAALYLSRYGWF